MTGTLVYDGDCGICNDSVRWVRAHLAAGEDVAVGLTRDDVDAAAWWIDSEGATHGGHEAVAKALEHCNGVWPAVGRFLAVWPASAGARLLYQWVADNRHRLSRRGQTCPAPPPS